MLFFQYNFFIFFYFNFLDLKIQNLVKLRTTEKSIQLSKKKVFSRWFKINENVNLMLTGLFRRQTVWFFVLLSPSFWVEPYFACNKNLVWNIPWLTNVFLSFMGTNVIVLDIQFKAVSKWLKGSEIVQECVFLIAGHQLMEIWCPWIQCSQKFW